jgi:hypothetical protein
MISNKTDIQIFIEHHRSDNQCYPRVEFSPYVPEDPKALKPAQV